jgi:uncharacterized protein YaaN involved in tellurite resistance
MIKDKEIVSVIFYNPPTATAHELRVLKNNLDRVESCYALMQAARATIDAVLNKCSYEVAMLDADLIQAQQTYNNNWEAIKQLAITPI